MWGSKASTHSICELFFSNLIGGATVRGGLVSFFELQVAKSTTQDTKESNKLVRTWRQARSIYTYI